MGKYEPITRYLLGVRADEVRVSFADLEAILGFSLPESARLYSAWWANESDGRHSQCRSWIDVGWKTFALDLNNRFVYFRKIGGD